jgi:hypothetical protein
MENDQRPWIKVEAQISSPLDFTTNFGTMRLRIILTNVGKSPAFNIQPAVWGFLVSAVHINPNKEQTHRCERLKQEPLDNAAKGFVLFPGDRIPWDQMGGEFTSGIGFSPQDIQRSLTPENG